MYVIRITYFITNKNGCNCAAFNLALNGLINYYYKLGVRNLMQF